MLESGVLPPATEFGRPGSGSNHIMPLLSSTPVPGVVTRLPQSERRVCVQETAMPSRSITLRCVVEPSAIWPVATALAHLVLPDTHWLESWGDYSPMEGVTGLLQPTMKPVRDARPMGKEHWTPVLAGRGLVPFGEVAAALKRLGYEGFVSFEWEKYWHPEIEEPEVSLPDFAGAMRGALGGAVGA